MRSANTTLNGKSPAPRADADARRRFGINPRTIVRLIQFCTVGFAGMAVDTVVVYALRASVGLYIAGLASYLVAASVTWFLNRSWTFRGVGTRPLHEEAALFLATNFLGFLLNRGTYFALITVSPICAAYPVLAIFAGAVAGVFANFSLSHRVVFK